MTIYCNKSNQITYPFVLPELPFAKDAFLPYFSIETFDYHHGKHHQGYVNNLNELLKKETDLIKKSLEEIILLSCNVNFAIFNNAAQIWNHSFFWHSIKPNGGGKPSGHLLQMIETSFGNFENFSNQFKQASVSQFGSGWVWLVHTKGKIDIIKTANADTPITLGIQPLIACDVWEHTYYIDYRNRRLDYISAYIEHMVNWDFAEKNLVK